MIKILKFHNNLFNYQKCIYQLFKFHPKNNIFNKGRSTFNVFKFHDIRNNDTVFVCSQYFGEMLT